MTWLSPQILKYTPEDHPDHQNLQEALTKANELCNQVNEGVREKDNSDKLEWIQAHTVCEGLSEVRADLLNVYCSLRETVTVSLSILTRSSLGMINLHNMRNTYIMSICKRSSL